MSVSAISSAVTSTSPESLNLDHHTLQVESERAEAMQNGPPSTSTAEVRPRAFWGPFCRLAGHYVVPVTAAAAWTVIVGASIAYGSYQKTQAKLHKDPADRDSCDACVAVMKTGAYLAASTVPLAMAATLVKTAYRGCSNICSGAREACRIVGETLVDSMRPSNFSKPEGILINTAVALVATPLILLGGIAYFCGRGRR